MIFNTDTVLKLGQMAQNMKVTTRTERNMERALTFGQTALAMLATGSITKLMAQAFTPG